MEERVLKTHYSNGCVGNVQLENEPRKKQNRIKSIIAASINWGDMLHETLHPVWQNDPNLKVKYYSNCANKYCFIKWKSQNQDPPLKRCSGQPTFNFQNPCIYCRLDCFITPNLSQKDQWRETDIALTHLHFCLIRNKLIE